MLYYRKIIPDEYELGWAPLLQNKDFRNKYKIYDGHCQKTDPPAAILGIDKFVIAAALSDEMCKTECTIDGNCRAYEF
jgi:cell wall assembly regulator SMI1